MAPQLESTAVFNMMKKRVEADPNKVKKINGVFQYNITKDGTTTVWSKSHYLSLPPGHKFGNTVQNYVYGHVHQLLGKFINIRGKNNIKNILTRRKESDTYLATVSRQVTMKIDQLL